MLTRIFKSGNSLAVRIPKELVFLDAAQDVEIERIGDSLVISPKYRKPIGDLSKLLADFPEGFMSDGREENEAQERPWPTHFASVQRDAGSE